MRPIVTLSTDFEERDPHVAMVKGTLCSSNTDINIVDLSHSLPRAGIMEASLYVTGAIRHFPVGAIHLVSVAGAAEPIAARVCGQTVLCPDNGIVTMLEFGEDLEEVRRITNSDIVTDTEGQVYLAKDVLAPGAVFLAKGGAFADLGDVITDFKRIDLHTPKVDSKQISGEIILIDHFGNLITNIDRNLLHDSNVRGIEVTGFPVGPLRGGFNEVEDGSPLAFVNSGGMVQISYRGDRADSRLGAQVGNKVVVQLG